jgi:predicted dehydrogenase
MKKVGILGYGARGHIYADYIKAHSDKIKLYAVVDTDINKIEKAKRDFKDVEVYSSVQSFIDAKPKLDAVLICTQDRDHFEHSKLALQNGYHILLEKPISPIYEECVELSALATNFDRKIIVCHVLWYTVFYQKIKEILKSNIIGDLVHIEQNEYVGYWHQAHSFVRGNWRDSSTSAPMILAKCCHDTDILCWLIEKDCENVSSFGSLKHFKPENAPANAGKRCTECRIAEDCCYNAIRFYTNNRDWMPLIFKENATSKEIIETLETSQYGRCVYLCDNNVVDHQVVNMQFDDNITASLAMIAFSEETNRQTRIHGTKGEIIGDFDKKTITVNIFAKSSYTIDIATLTNDFSNHGGGDNRLMDDFVNVLEGNEADCIGLSTIESSIASHLIAFAAERSRINNGVPEKIQPDR